MIATVLMTGMLLGRTDDAWDIKPTFTTGKKITWATKIDATANGESHAAAMNLVLTPGEKIDTGGRKMTLAWDKVELDGNPRDVPVSYALTIGDDGVVREKTGDDADSVRRFASVYSFAYPDKPVKVGDKWTVDVTPKEKNAGKISYAFEAKEVSKVGDQDVLKVSSTETESGSDGIKNTGTWYVAHDGSILKFKLDVKNWVVPVAGPDPVDAVITGEISKT